MNQARRYLAYRRGWRLALAAVGLPVLLLLVGLIRGYQLVVSPLLGPRCKFYPSCSKYGSQALLVHGIGKGLLLLAGRIGRCHPWQLGGINPVPPYGAWRADVDLDGVPCPHSNPCGSKPDLVGV